MKAGELRTLLDRLGTLYSMELGIDLSRNTPGVLFRWFVASLLFGARISERAATDTYRALERRGLADPKRLVRARHAALIEVMGEGGYVRYDEKTSDELQRVAREALDWCGGDLRRIHAAATDPRDIETKLDEFYSVGPITARIFLRELRGLWTKADPPLSWQTVLAARHLGLPSTLPELKTFWKRNRVRGRDFRHLEAALFRLGNRFCKRRRCESSPVPHRI